jgi:hypothetical protein
MPGRDLSDTLVRRVLSVLAVVTLLALLSRSPILAVVSSTESSSPGSSLVKWLPAE